MNTADTPLGRGGRATTIAGSTFKRGVFTPSLRGTLLVCFLLSASRQSPRDTGTPSLEERPLARVPNRFLRLVKCHNRCIRFQVLFIAEDFFKELQEHNTPQGREFRIKKRKDDGRMAGISLFSRSVKRPIITRSLVRVQTPPNPGFVAHRRSDGWLR